MIKESKRWKKIYYTTRTGSSYFMHQGRRWHLDEFLTCNIDTVWHGVMGLTNSSSMLIRISNDGLSLKTAISY